MDNIFAYITYVIIYDNNICLYNLCITFMNNNICLYNLCINIIGYQNITFYFCTIISYHNMLFKVLLYYTLALLTCLPLPI